MIGVGIGLSSVACHNTTYSPPVDKVLQLGLGGLAIGGNLDNSRTSTALVVDHDGVEHTAKVGETRQQGARRIEQKLAYTEDFSNVAWAKSASGTGVVAIKAANYNQAPDGATTACRVYMNLGGGTTISDSSSFYQTISAISNARGSIYIKSNTGSSYVIGIGTNNVMSTITVTTSWQRFATDLDTGSATELRLEIRGASGQASIADIAVWHPMMEDKTGASINTPANYVASSVEYNATCLGVEYHSTTNGNTVVSNVVTNGSGGSISPTPYYLCEPAATNYFINSDSPATQTIALSAGTYTISIVGAGSIVLSSGATGTVTSAAPLTFTTVGSTVFTKTGVVTRAQVESGTKATSYIASAGTASSRSADVVQVTATAGTNWIQNSGLLLMKFTPMYASTDTSATPLFSGGSISVSSATGYRVSDGTNTVDSAASGMVSGTTVILATIWDFDEASMSNSYSNNGGVSFQPWHSGVYDGLFPLPASFEWFSANPFVNRLYATRIYTTVGKTLAQMEAWVGQNATTELS